MASGGDRDRDSCEEEQEGSPAAYKIILVGEPGVGKTTTFFRIKLDEFVDTSRIRQHPVLQHSIKVDGNDVKVYLYDTAGGEHHRTLTSNYYEKADAAILVYSIEDNFTFQNLHYWIDEAQQFVDPGGFTWALLGNKCDLPAEILEGQVKHLADELKTELSFFISAKTGENVKNAFEYIIESVHRAKLGQPQTSSTVKITSVLHPQPQEREVVEFEDSSEDIEKDQEEEETPQPQAIATEQSNPKKSCKIS